MIEQDVSIPGKGVVLSGTLCLPHVKGRFPTVLWLQGSGPIDRDDNMPGQILNNAKSVAQHLAEHGIATLRFDKRGVGKSTGEFLSAGHSDLVEDGLSCLKFLTQSEFCKSDCIFAIGHSEGAIIAPQISQKSEQVVGIVLLCPTIEDPEELLLRQAENLKRMIDAQTWLKRPLAKFFLSVFNPTKTQPKLIARVRSTDAKVGRLGFSKQPFHWLRQFLELDLVKIFSNTKCSVLAIAGAKDFQCLPNDVYRIGDVIQGDCDSHIIEDMSHLLRSEPGEACIFNYAAQLKQPIDSRVLMLIRNWIQQRLNSGSLK